MTWAIEEKSYSQRRACEVISPRLESIAAIVFDLSPAGRQNTVWIGTEFGPSNERRKRLLAVG